MARSSAIPARANLRVCCTNRAQDLITRHIPALALDQVKRALELAALECVRNGLTSVQETRVTRLMIQAYAWATDTSLQIGIFVKAGRW